jgi:hypothetical protein
MSNYNDVQPGITRRMQRQIGEMNLTTLEKGRKNLENSIDGPWNVSLSPNNINMFKELSRQRLNYINTQIRNRKRLGLQGGRRRRSRTRRTRRTRRNRSKRSTRRR